MPPFTRSMVGQVLFLEGPPGHSLLRDAAGITSLLEECFAVPTRRALLYAENMPPAFFDVSSGEAGIFLQRLRTYGLRVAVVAPTDAFPTSHRFAELLTAERLDRRFGLFDSRATALLWLAE